MFDDQRAPAQSILDLFSEQLELPGPFITPVDYVESQ